MSYFKSIKLEQSVDSGLNDAFGRLRVSMPLTIFDSKQIFNHGNILWDESGSNGGTFVYNQINAETTLTVTNTAGSTAIRQTKQWFNYQSGKSQQVFITGHFSSSLNGIIRRMGYYNGEDGLFLEQSGSNINLVIGKSGSADTRISQSNWNMDKYDGTGASGETLNISNNLIFCIDFEWLGVGQVRYGFVKNGLVTYVHKVDNNASNVVYMSTPNLPIRYEIINAGGAAGTHTLDAICSSVVSEGGTTDIGILRSVLFSSLVTGSSLALPNSAPIAIRPLLALRLNPSWNGTTVKIENIDILNTVTQGTQDASTIWSLLINPTISGSALAWNNIPSSSVQFATGSYGMSITSSAGEGIKIECGMFSTQIRAATQGINSFLSIGRKIDKTSDVYVLAVENVVANAGATATKYNAAITYREN